MGTTLDAAQLSPAVIDRMVKKLEHMLDQLAAAKPFAKSQYQTDVFQVAELLLGSAPGIAALYGVAHRLDDDGVFAGGPWADASRLQPPLVGGSLKAKGVYAIVECLSELRMLAIAQERCRHAAVSADEARAFLEEAMALNLDLIFPGDTEQDRIEGGPHRDTSVRLFGFLAETMGLDFLRDKVLNELQQVSAQRPIMTGRIRRMIAMANRIPPSDPNAPAARELASYDAAINGCTALCKESTGLSGYRDALIALDGDALEREAVELAESVTATGLLAPQHAVFLRYLCGADPDLLPSALLLTDTGWAEYHKHQAFVLKLIKIAILPVTCQSILGLSHVLNKGLLSRQEVAVGFERIVDLDLHPEAHRCLLANRDGHDGATANAILLAGVMAVLGQPLGVGQGKNPTCQSARAISLWSQCAPAYLLEHVISAARDGIAQIPFEGDMVVARQETNTQHDLDLDAVSIVLVPLLDQIYGDMLGRVALRHEDAHKWVNPAFYGRWVPNGFASVFAGPIVGTVARYEDFVRQFFATHHPAYNDGHHLMYPNPVGLCVTNGHGVYMGLHAVSIQRVAEDPSGKLRVYFFNPNNEGRQNWGRGVTPTIDGHGEIAGESSLPFKQFVTRLYAFHYNPYEQGEAYAVRKKDVEEIEEQARATWGPAFTWQD